MNKIKVIDLLNRIAKGKEVPKKIKVFGDEFEFLYQSGDRTYFNYDGDYLFSDEYAWENNLNNEVEIIEEEKEFEDIEAFGIHYSWDYIDYKNIEELKKYVNKDFQNIFDTLDKLIKNQKKIIDVINDMRDRDETNN